MRNFFVVDSTRWLGSIVWAQRVFFNISINKIQTRLALFLKFFYLLFYLFNNMLIKRWISVFFKNLNKIQIFIIEIMSSPLHQNFLHNNNLTSSTSPQEKEDLVYTHDQLLPSSKRIKLNHENQSPVHHYGLPDNNSHTHHHHHKVIN